MGNLSDFVRELRALKRLPSEVAKEAAPLVEEAIRKQAAAGVDPNGNAWPLTKSGKKPLAGAADAINATSSKATIEVKLDVPELFHDRGTKRVPRRQILPNRGEIPPHVEAALRAASDRVFARMTSGAR